MLNKSLNTFIGKTVSQGRFSIPKKAPIIDGRRPDKQYDLDNESDILELGLDIKSDLKIADKYAHYEDCRFAVIEFKSSTLRKGVEQIESTVKRLSALGRKVDTTIIVAERLNSYEQKLFKVRKDHILREQNTDNPRLIRVGSKAWEIRFFYAHQVDTMYDGLNKYLPR